MQAGRPRISASMLAALPRAFSCISRVGKGSRVCSPSRREIQKLFIRFLKVSMITLKHSDLEVGCIAESCQTNCQVPRASIHGEGSCARDVHRSCLVRFHSSSCELPRTSGNANRAKFP